MEYLYQLAAELEGMIDAAPQRRISQPRNPDRAVADYEALWGGSGDPQIHAETIRRIRADLTSEWARWEQYRLRSIARSS